MSNMNSKITIGKKNVLTVLVLFLVSSVICLTELIILDPTLKKYSDNLFGAVALFALTFLLILIVYIYLLIITKRDKHLSRTVGVVFSALTVTVLLSFVVNRFISNYAMPIALCGLLIVLISDKRIAIFTTAVTAQIVFVAYSVSGMYFNNASIGDAVAVVTSMASGLFIVYFIDQNYTRMRLIAITFITGIVMGIFAVLATAMAKESVPVALMSGVWTIAGNVGAVTLTFLILPFIEKIFGLVSNFSLMEYCSFENPILMRLKTEAPGTFNHSLVVANLAEHCAFAIGKNPALARAAAYYHDVGKLKDPEYFIENQRDGRNPHDDLIPEVSVRKITIHTDEGYKLLTASNFPKIICDVAREHHGDSPLYSFYYKAQNITEGTLKYEQYRYRGPKPSSATAAIVMLADIVEAASRTKGSMDSNAISELVNNLVRDKIMNNQFDECDITMNELNIIKKTIVNVLPGIYHGRLSYPEKKS